MVPTRMLCDQHLLGEHVECHMFVGTLRRKKKVSGYIERNLFEPKSLNSRHDELAREMLKRGMHHKSALEQIDVDYLPSEQKNAMVDKKASLCELRERCENCRRRMQNE